jgi:hypothetical protein
VGVVVGRRRLQLLVPLRARQEILGFAHVHRIVRLERQIVLAGGDGVGEAIEREVGVAEVEQEQRQLRQIVAALKLDGGVGEAAELVGLLAGLEVQAGELVLRRRCRVCRPRRRRGEERQHDRDSRRAYE